MKELQKNDHYKIIKVDISAGNTMPRHFATSDAYVIVESGNALLICKHETAELTTGSHVSIPAYEPRMLKIIENFSASVVLASGAVIEFSAV
jgi:quercetin dioxygenase-like cupin family protein